MIRMHVKVVWKWLLEADKSSGLPLLPARFSPIEGRLTSQMGGSEHHPVRQRRREQNSGLWEIYAGERGLDLRPK